MIGRLHAALAEDSRTNLLDIEIKVTANKLFLIGEVTSEDRRAAVETVVREAVPTDMAIFNELWIASYAEPEQTETLP